MCESARLHNPSNQDWRWCQIAWCSPEYQSALELRHRVLREPLGLKFTAEELDAEATQWHFAGMLGGRLVATLTAQTLADGSVKLRQMAVEPEFQRQGWGRRLLDEVEQDMAEHGHRFLVLHARQSAVDFYTAGGYQPEGEPFVEVGLPHRRMVKKL